MAGERASVIVAYIEAQTDYEGNWFPNAVFDIMQVNEAVSTGRFFVIETDAAPAPMFSDASIFDVVCQASSLSNLEAMRKKICGLGNKGATAYIPTNSTYPYWIEFEAKTSNYDQNTFVCVLQCEARWAL